MRYYESTDSVWQVVAMSVLHCYRSRDNKRKSSGVCLDAPSFLHDCL